MRTTPASGSVTSNGGVAGPGGRNPVRSEHVAQRPGDPRGDDACLSQRGKTSAANVRCAGYCMHVQLGEYRAAEISPSEVVAGLVDMPVGVGYQGRQRLHRSRGHVRGVGQAAFVQRHAHCASTRTDRPRVLSVHRTRLVPSPLRTASRTVYLVA